MIKYVLLLFLFSGCMDVAVTDLVLYAAKHDCACDAGGHVKHFFECTDNKDGTGTKVQPGKGTHWCCATCSKICHKQ